MIEEPAVLTIRRSFPRPTKAQVEAFQGMPTGFVCDAMDGRGGLGGGIEALGFGRDIDCRAVGIAIVAENGPEELLATFGALHVMEPGDILVASVRGGTGFAAVGDQVCGMVRNKGGAALVTDGAVRDYEGIVETGLPVWCAGLNPNSPYANGPGRVGFGASLGGQQIESGDIIVADRTGVAVVPFARIDEVIAKLGQVKAAEDALEARVKAGLEGPDLIPDMIAAGKVRMID